MFELKLGFVLEKKEDFVAKYFDLPCQQNLCV